LQYLDENINSASVKLDKEELAAVRKLAEESELPGERLPAASMQHVLKDTPELKK
jgi:hypothetical protein